VLQNNGGDNLSKNNGSTSFTFTTSIADGLNYSVTVATQPTGLGCTITNGSGTVSGANITNVAINCVAMTETYTWGTFTDNFNGKRQFCPTNDNACDNGTIATSGPAYTTCDTLDFAGKTNWRVPTKAELKTLIHCTDRIMPSDDSSCGLGNYTSPSVNNLFPNTVAGSYWSSSVNNSVSAWNVAFSNGNTVNSLKGNSLYIRCVLTGQ
jgi:hypothetical protein